MAKQTNPEEQKSEEAVMVVEKVAREVSKFIGENKNKCLEDFDIQVREDCVSGQQGITIDIEYI